MRHRVREFSIEELEEIVFQLKEDLTRECERAVRRHDAESAFVSYAAVMAKDYLDTFVREVKRRADSQLQGYLSRPPRARPIRINKQLLSKAK